MDRLWAPWRLTYITGDKKGDTPQQPQPGCIFCAKPQEDRDAENYIVLRGEVCYVILNAFPYNNGHVMVIPYRHISAPVQLTPEEGSEMMALCSYMTGLLGSVYRPDGYNIGINVGSAAGAGIAAHLHLHIVPRWGGDTNFMPVVGDVKVLPETLDQTWRKITEAHAAALAAAAASDTNRE